MNDQIFYDLSEFVSNPVRTGIQRVSYEVLKNWKFSTPLAPAFILADTGQPRLLPKNFLTLMELLFDGDAGAQQDAPRRIAQCVKRDTRRVTADELDSFIGFLNPELFFEPHRLDFYGRLAARMGERIHWIVYDPLVWLCPDLFPSGAIVGTMDYLKTLRAIPNLYFISDECRRSFCERILRTSRPTYRVCSLGADALGRAPPKFSASRKCFTCVGTIEPRKNHWIVLQAFREIWDRGIDAQLAFVGRLGWNSEKLSNELAKMSGHESRFVWHRNLDDARTREVIASSRATIYASEMEGFGLPPLESLALGVPVIASKRLPSLSVVPDLGQIRLSQVSVASIVDAVTAMLDDTFAAQKYREISQLEVPTWSGLADFLSEAIVSR